MLRYNLVMLAVGGLTMAAITPRDQADAQSGQSLAFAEHARLEQRRPRRGRERSSAAWRSAAQAFDRGEPDLADAEARIARAAREACKTSGKTPVACADGLTKP